MAQFIEIRNDIYRKAKEQFIKRVIREFESVGCDLVDERVDYDNVDDFQYDELSFKYGKNKFDVELSIRGATVKSKSFQATDSSSADAFIRKLENSSMYREKLGRLHEAFTKKEAAKEKSDLTIPSITPPSGYKKRPGENDKDNFSFVSGTFADVNAGRADFVREIHGYVMDGELLVFVADYESPRGEGSNMFEDRIPVKSQDDIARAIKKVLQDYA